MSQKTLNLGILAHVDAGKTTLTERLLYAAGVIDEIGSVDHGTTQTDSLALERQRGITIKSAVVSFAIDDVTVNLIDTPGHPDFIAEVERVLSVLDGAVLVISAVEGVQPQTRLLMRALAAAAHSDALVREQDRPSRRRRRTRAASDLGAADAGDRPGRFRRTTSGPEPPASRSGAQTTACFRAMLDRGARRARRRDPGRVSSRTRRASRTGELREALAAQTRQRAACIRSSSARRSPERASGR